MDYMNKSSSSILAQIGAASIALMDLAQTESNQLE